MPEESMVGQDIGSPLQNPVPRSYQADPFQTAQYQEGTGQAETRGGLGFRRRPPERQAYLTDPFEGVEGRRVEYTRPGDAQLSPDLISHQVDSSGESLAPPPPPEAPPTRLDEFAETGEVTTENIPDIYSLRPEEFERYGYSEDNPPPGHMRTEDGHWVNTMTPQGEQSIQDVLDDPSAGLPAERNLFERGVDYAERFAQPGQRLNAAGEVVTTSPGGAISAALPPGFGAIAAVGGAISARNLDNIHNEYGEYSADDGMGYIGRNELGAGTPLAISEGFIPGTSVVSGNTELAIMNNPALDVNGDGELNAIELRDAIAAREAVQAEEARQAEIERLEQQQAYAAAEHARQQAEAAERARQEELTRQQRAAEEAARREQERQANQRAAQEEARRQEDARRAEAQRRANESGREQTYGGGSAVTDSRGNAVRDSGGNVVTDRHNTVRPERDSGGGGGGDSCFAGESEFLMEDGSLKQIKDIVVGDRMAEGGRVYGILQGDGSIEDWYVYGDTYVTGSHFVLEDKWVPVAKSAGAELLWGGFDTWYCVLNENHKLVAKDYIVYTDFDAVDSVNDELEERLNAVQE